MSGTEPPDRLEAARQELSGRGYLAGGLPAPPASPWVVAVRLALAGAALAVVLAAAEVGFGGQPATTVFPVAVAFLPAAVLLVAVGYGLCRWLAWGMLRLGGEPEAVATAGAVLVGAAVVALLAAMGRPAVPGLATIPGVAGGLALALVGMRWMRRHLLARFSYPAAAGRRQPVTGAALLAVVAMGVLGVLVLAQRQDEASPEVAASFPQPHGRVAVVAVDGLAREDLEAAAGLTGLAGLREATLWGWAPMEVPQPPLPVVFWTTLACGVPPALHGITVLEEVRLFGLQDGVPLSPVGRAAIVPLWQGVGAARVVARPATVRHRPTFWEMASRAGVPVTVGGWWGSWPVRRVLGEVASERAWLGGDGGTDAVTPGLAGTVASVWGAGHPDPAAASDRLALAVTERVAAAASPHLLAVAMPALDIQRRAHPRATPWELAQLQLPHLEALEGVLTRLVEAGSTVWLVGAPWHGGTGFVAVSGAPAGRYEPCVAEAVAATVLDALGLPIPLALPAPRRDLSGVGGPILGAVDYGPPPPPLAAPSPRGQQVQRELLRNLGYLQ